MNENQNHNHLMLPQKDIKNPQICNLIIEKDYPKQTDNNNQK